MNRHHRPSSAVVALLMALMGAPSLFATHIAGIEGNTLVIVAGRTQSFTVDTPEDQGLVATKPDVPTLLAELAARDGSGMAYHVMGADGAAKTAGEIDRG